MNFRVPFLVSVFFSLCLAVTACGGGGGGGGGGSDSGGGSGGGSTEIDITDPAALSYDISQLDVSAQSGSEGNISALMKRAIGGEVGDDSIAGCQVDQMGGEAVRIAKQVDLINCYVSHMLDAAGEEIPTDEFAYFSVAVPEGFEGEDFSIKVRVGKFGEEFRMDACEGGALSMELRTTLTDTTLDASVVNHFAQGEFDEKMSVDFNVELEEGATEMTVDTVSSADITAEFDGNFGLGRMDFTYDGTTATNTVSGVHQGNFGAGDSFTGQIGGEWDATAGAAKYSATGSFPGIPAEFLPPEVSGSVGAGQVACPDFEDCDPGENFENDPGCQFSPDISCFCFEVVAESEGCTFSESGTEAFSIAYDTGTEEKTFTLVETNAFVDPVTALTLPGVEDISIAFADNWDCSGTFTPVTFTSPPTTCMAMEEEVAGGNEDHDSCFQEKGEDIGEEGGEL
ncbi:MAG: hypothetical protein HYU99_09135 [Deltaproteobacteria bacterium]|nr:hypothetical protein [Deltaproteobacteria bacterium]